MAIPTIGAVPNVADGADIQTDWGNAVGSSATGRTVSRFVTRATLASAIPAPVEGMVAAVTADPSGAAYLAMVQGGAFRALLVPRQAGQITLLSASGGPGTFDRTVNFGTALPQNSLIMVWCNSFLGFMPAGFTNGAMILYTNQATAPGPGGAMLCQGFTLPTGAGATWYPMGTQWLCFVQGPTVVPQVILRGQWSGGGSGGYTAGVISYLIFDAPTGGPIPTATVAPAEADRIPAELDADAALEAQLGALVAAV